MSEPTQILTHSADAVAMLLSTLQDTDPNAVEIVSILGDISQSLEDAIWECLVERYVSTAEGVQLDAWGRVLGRRRNGMTDDEYRLILSVWQAACLGQGRRDFILHAVITVLDPELLEYSDRADAWYSLALFFVDPPGPWSATVAEVLEDILRAASPSGVQWRVVQAEYGAGFQFDRNALGFDQGEMGDRML